MLNGGGHLDEASTRDDGSGGGGVMGELGKCCVSIADEVCVEGGGGHSSESATSCRMMFSVAPTKIISKTAMRKPAPHKVRTEAVAAVNTVRRCSSFWSQASCVWASCCKTLSYFLLRALFDLAFFLAVSRG